MVIKNGIVKYKDREDIQCTYGIMDDGKQYYFLDVSDDKKLSNGNIIASTALIEAVDPMVRANNIGVIDANGKEIIPFSNRSIKLIGDGLLLVETATPSTESVVEAIKEKNDPSSAAKLVSTSASIKEKMNQKMGPNGRYVFNDQFSEATIFDEDGNNLLNGEFFSFVGMNEDKLFLSKNTLDSSILVYSLSLPPKVADDGNNVNSESIDVSEVEVSKDAIEEALNASEVSTTEPLESVDDNSVGQEDVGTVVEDDSSVMSESLDEASEVVAETPSIDEDVDGSVETAEEAGAQGQDSDDVAVTDTLVNDISMDDEGEKSVDMNSSFFDVGEETSDNTIDDDDLKLDDVDNDLAELDPDDDFDDDKFQELKADSIVDTDYDSYDDSLYDTHERPGNETIMDDLAKSMSGLLRQNRNLKESLTNYEKRFDVYQHRVRLLEQKNVSLSMKCRKLESSLKSLEEKVHSQTQIIESQARELKGLRPQGNLYKLLEDAHTLLEEDNY